MLFSFSFGERARRLFHFPMLAPVMAAFVCGCKSAAPQRFGDLGPTLQRHPEKFSRILASPEEYRVQILVSEVSHGHLKRSAYRVGEEYFYPASSIKLCAAIAALQTIKKFQAEKHTPDLLNAPMEIAPLFPGDGSQRDDASNSAGEKTTVGHELRKLALVSDNRSFNRFYDLVGHEELNRRMHALGLDSVVINHRLSETRTIPDQKVSAAVTLFPNNSEPVQIPARKSTLVLTNRSNGLLIGSGHMQDDQLIRTPMDFSARNGISLVDLQNLLIKLARPDIDLGTPPLKLETTHREWLLKAMTEYPRESANPVYSAKEFPDQFSKFLLPGIRRIFPGAVPGERIEVTGKNGQAYGFSVENSYSYNPKNGRAIFVTAVIYANSDGIVGDDKYDYATVAEPFLANLGEVIAREFLSGK